MPLYEYYAYNRAGKLSTGLIDARSNKNAYEKLKANNLFPQKISVDSKPVSKSALTNDRLSFVLVQLATLLKAGVPIDRAVDSVLGQTDSKDMSRVLARIKTFILEGKSFSGAMKEEKSLPPLLIKMAEAGESVGNLETILENYALFLEKESESAKKMVSALIYPTVVVCASVLLILFILTYITPILSDIFNSFGRQLPFISAILVSFGTFLKNNFLILFVLIVLSIFIFTKYVPKKVKDDLKILFPYTGEAYKFMVYSRWARTLGMLHGGGIPLLKSLESARKVTDNESIEKDLVYVENKVEKGESFSKALSIVFPPLIVNMVETGQQTGELAKMMNSVADFYEKEADRKINIFLKLFEPAMIIALGITIGFIVISVLLPIFEINSIVR
ncbi:type II secretion system F family protein [bacterium]|nr:type II secretion system F family protein [bacterium]